MILDENAISETPVESIHLSDREIFKKIWLSPRIVFRFIEQKSYGKYVAILLVLAGISSALDRASMRSSGDTMSLWGVIGSAVLFGGLLGWISYYIYAALLRWTGKWVNGRGNTKSIVRMLAYASIPSITSLILVFAQIGVFGNGIFSSFFNLYVFSSPLIIFFYLTVFLGVALSLWTIVLVVIGLSEVQQLSVGKAILNMLLPIMVIVIPVAIIAFIVGDIFG